MNNSLVTITDRIEDTKARIEERLLENKSSVKTYASRKAAFRTAVKLADNLKDYWGVSMVHLEILELDNGRFTPVVDLDTILQNSTTGGYVGAYLDGFFTISIANQVLNRRAA